MDKKTKIFLGVAAVAAVAYFTRDMWMPKKDEAKKEGEVKSGFISAQDKLGTLNPTQQAKCPDTCQTIQTTSGTGCRCRSKTTGLVTYIKL